MSKKVLLIGWDAADWKIITPLMDAGWMPTLNQFINDGVMGNIATLTPAISPILWNSISTGKLPEKHGILGFVEPMPDGSGIRPANSTSRKCKAIWNILSQSNLSSNVVGWFASHPAEPIRGVCVSNQFYLPTVGQSENWPIIPQSVSPPHLAEKLAEFRVHPHEIEGEHLQPFLPRGIEIDQSLKIEQQRITSLKKHMAECASVHAITTWLMENEPADFTAVYYNAIDIIGHYFMAFHPPLMAGIDEKDFEMYKEVISGIYRFHDMMLRRLLQLAGPDTTVILLSDHGFHSDHLRPQLGTIGYNDPTAWHRSHGILCMKGPGIMRDERIYGSSLLDITPTILNLFDLPVGEDMDGKALIQAFETPPAIQRIPSWENVPGESGSHPPDLRQDPIAAQEAIQQLVDLGYIEAPSPDSQKNVRQVVDNMQFNLGISQLNYGKPQEAVKIFENLLAAHPEDKQYAFPLIQAHFKTGNFPKARALSQKFLQHEENSPVMEMMLGGLLQAEGETQKGLEHFLRAEKMAPEMIQVQLHLGSAYLTSRKWKEAETAFRRYLDQDSDNPEACHGLSTALMRQHKFEESVDFALRAVGLRHFFPEGHFQLGMVLAHLNQPERAAQAFEHGLSMKPDSLVAHRYLARLYYRLGDFRKSHEHHEAFFRLKDKERAAAKSI